MANTKTLNAVDNLLARFLVEYHHANPGNAAANVFNKYVAVFAQLAEKYYNGGKIYNAEVISRESDGFTATLLIRGFSSSVPMPLSRDVKITIIEETEE